MQQHLPLPNIELPAGSVLPPAQNRRVYCNRNLRLDQVDMIGFDMDYTLAIYRQSEMDRVSIEATVKKLVDKGYPEALLTMDYRIDFPIRGLLVDRKLGNVLKMDRYRYVKKAYHGLRELSREERRRLYHTRRLRPSTQRYHWVDTLYALSEVAVYSAAIEHLESLGQKVDFDQLFADVRESADLSHQDGSILDEVLANLPLFVEKDPQLGATLHKLRSAGKRLFLLTNSGPEYTETMMTYLVGDAMAEYPSWRQYFDYTISFAKKPTFFTERRPFTLVGNGGGDVERIERGKMYTGGNIVDLEKSFRLSGDQILYIGDHIYGDVLRAKKDSAWRTAMILQELEDEMQVHEEIRDESDRADALTGLRTSMRDELREHQSHLKRIEKQLDRDDTENQPTLRAARTRHKHALDRLRHQLKAIEQELSDLKERIEKAFHPFWGSFFKAGGEVSSFGDQVEQYAGLYTSRVSNFYHYSPMHYFESPRDRMPHER